MQMGKARSIKLKNGIAILFFVKKQTIQQLLLEEGCFAVQMTQIVGKLA